MGTRRSVTQGQHNFAQIPSANIQRSRFNRSCGLKTTFDAGELIPIFCDEALPGDTMQMRTSLFGRLATPLHPVMENMFLDIFYFAVPVRLLWENWEKMNGAQINPGDSTDFMVPIMTSPAATGYPVESLSDYLGIPVQVPDLDHVSLWHRAYNLIWNEWFRDENLQDSVVVDFDDGPDDPADYVVLRRGKRHDYFTSCLPFPQKGPAVELPLGLSAPLTITGDGEPVFQVTGVGNSPQKMGASSSSANVILNGGPPFSSGIIAWDDPKLEADLSSATAATINQIREAFQFQRMFERDARGGTRYTEILRSHFGVVSPDQRLQRPEFLGGGSTRINFNPVAQTVDNPVVGEFLGDLGAVVTATSTGQGFLKSFTEHSVILGLCSVRADLNYQQGLLRMFSRRSRFEFYWPSLAHLGEQAVLNKEIFAQGTAADLDVFGYQERYAEYRYKPSQITGKMRSAAAQTLDSWHLAQDFESLPLLNETFIEENPPVDRIIAVPSQSHMLLDCYFEYNCARPMPLFSVPGMIDHF